MLLGEAEVLLIVPAGLSIEPLSEREEPGGSLTQGEQVLGLAEEWSLELSTSLVPGTYPLERAWHPLIPAGQRLTDPLQLYGGPGEVLLEAVSLFAEASRSSFQAARAWGELGSLCSNR